jgi:hypothetical protein
MNLTDIISSKFGKSFAVIAIVAMLGGCAGVTDAGLTQEANQQPAQETQVDDNNEEQPEEGPFNVGGGDEPGVIYDEPDL